MKVELINQLKDAIRAHMLNSAAYKESEDREEFKKAVDTTINVAMQYVQPVVDSANDKRFVVERDSNELKEDMEPYVTSFRNILEKMIKEALTLLKVVV